MCIIRVTQLQYQLQELSERERRARHHNQKLLQDFQRAQNTLSDLVARNEAMNTIRMEYERFLEENCPKWQQRLQEKRLSEEQKVLSLMLEQHLKTCRLRREEAGQRIGTGNNQPFRINTSTAISPDPSYCAILHSLQHISDHRNDVAEVNISTYYGDTSESSDLYTKVVKSFPTKVQRVRNKRREEKQTHNNVSEGSSSVSDSQSVSNHKKQKRKEQSYGRKSALKTSKVAENSPKQLVKENKDDSIDGTLTSICCTLKTGSMKRYIDDTEEEEKISPGDMRVNKATNRDSTENQGNRAIMCDERDKKGEVEERYSDTSVKESRVLEEVDSVRESEAEEGGVGEEEEEDEVKGDEDEKNRASGRRSNEDENKSDQEGNCSEVLKSGSERSIQDSLRELYKDDTEDDLAENEENIDEEEEEEEEEEDDDDDDVIVEHSSPRTCHLVAEDSKYQDDDDDDDIEGLLAPQNTSLQHQ
ncbi:hypothetical protein QTP70_020963 [Hemibagrus guttatus]|uniref:Uncharacterized protein n=1 Tax=Hemibagrus guttatus TaxID=175788 RepID=A0AAE0V2A5_9TELE|nr:hypothetical protein QTP70_020963 [Hemibagrus guttatus]